MGISTTKPEIQGFQQGELREFHPEHSKSLTSAKIHIAVNTELLGQLEHPERSKLQSDPANIHFTAYSQRIQVPGEREEKFRASVLWQEGWSLFKTALEIPECERKAD